MAEESFARFPGSKASRCSLDLSPVGQYTAPTLLRLCGVEDVVDNLDNGSPSIGNSYMSNLKAFSD